MCVRFLDIDREREIFVEEEKGRLPACVGYDIVRHQSLADISLLVRAHIVRHRTFKIQLSSEVKAKTLELYRTTYSSLADSTQKTRQ